MSHEELCQTAKGLANVFDSGDDLEQLLKITKSEQDKLELIKKRNVEVKRLVRALAKLADSEGKQSAVRQQENKENYEAISKLKNEKSSKAMGIEKLNGALELLENSIRQISEESARLNEQKAGVQDKVGDTLPKTKYSFSLYSNITRLRWDYNMDDDKLQGYVTSLGEVRPFSLNVKEHSEHFIANYLWDVIASAKNSQAKE